VWAIRPGPWTEYQEFLFFSFFAQRPSPRWDRAGTARSVEDGTRNAELNGNRNPEWWGDFSQLAKIDKIKFLGISRYKVGYLAVQIQREIFV